MGDLQRMSDALSLLSSVEPSAEYAKERPDWRYIEPKAGHDAIVTHPEQIAHILLAESDLRR